MTCTVFGYFLRSSNGGTLILIRSSYCDDLKKGCDWMRKDGDSVVERLWRGLCSAVRDDRLYDDEKKCIEVLYSLPDFHTNRKIWNCQNNNKQKFMSILRSTSTTVWTCLEGSRDIRLLSFYFLFSVSSFKGFPPSPCLTSPPQRCNYIPTHLGLLIFSGILTFLVCSTYRV